MWQGFTIALREGIEAFLIVALILSYLKRTGRAAPFARVYAGMAVSVVTCFGAGLLSRRPRTSLSGKGSSRSSPRLSSAACSST